MTALIHLVRNFVDRFSCSSDCEFALPDGFAPLDPNQLNRMSGGFDLDGEAGGDPFDDGDLPDDSAEAEIPIEDWNG